MRRLFCLIALVAAFVALGAAPAGAIGLTGGCQGQGASFDADHNQIMAATAPSAEPGTSGNPFLVDYDGTVEYAGTGPLMLNHHWDIEIFGITVKSEARRTVRSRRRRSASPMSATTSRSRSRASITSRARSRARAARATATRS